MKNISFRNDVLPMKNELFRLALRITRNAQETEDVAQETLIKVWDRRDSWHLIDNIEAFCMTTCRNMSIDRCRKLDNSHLSLGQEIVQIPSGGNNPLENTAVSDKVEQVRLLIASLKRSISFTSPPGLFLSEGSLIKLKSPTRIQFVSIGI